MILTTEAAYRAICCLRRFPHQIERKAVAIFENGHRQCFFYHANDSPVARTSALTEPSFGVKVKIAAFS
jgi:hypothetical protein